MSPRGRHRDPNSCCESLRTFVQEYPSFPHTACIARTALHAAASAVALFHNCRQPAGVSFREPRYVVSLQNVSGHLRNRSNEYTRHAASKRFPRTRHTHCPWRFGRAMSRSIRRFPTIGLGPIQRRSYAQSFLQARSRIGLSLAVGNCDRRSE